MAFSLVAPVMLNDMAFSVLLVFIENYEKKD